MSNDSSNATSAFVSGGYRIVLPFGRPEAMDATLIPERILTQSDCLGAMAPAAWSIRWVTETDEKRRATGGKFGLMGADLDRFVDWTTAAIQQDILGWPGVFFDVDAALAAKKDFFADNDDVVLCGVGIAEGDVAAFVVETETTGPQEGMTGIGAAVRLGLPPDPRGELVGFDVLGWDMGGFHSYICNGLQDDFRDQLGATPNARGLYDTMSEAAACAQFAGLDSTGAEPGLWLPWEVRVYR